MTPPSGPDSASASASAYDHDADGPDDPGFGGSKSIEASRRLIATAVGVDSPAVRALADWLIANGDIQPGKVFDLTLPLDRAAEGYRAMDQRTATKVLLTL